MNKYRATSKLKDKDPVKAQMKAKTYDQALRNASKLAGEVRDLSFIVIPNQPIKDEN